MKKSNLTVQERYPELFRKLRYMSPQFPDLRMDLVRVLLDIDARLESLERACKSKPISRQGRRATRSQRAGK
jgi:hypothetical protein